MLDETPDIPEATRETVETKVSSGFPILWLAVGGVVLGAIAIAVMLPLMRSTKKLAKPIAEEIVKPETVDETEAITKTEFEEFEKVDNVLGHLPYEQVTESALAPITADGRIRLHQAAAAKFNQMQAAARNQGIILNPISGFRTVEAQDYLFFGVKEQRVQDASKRAEVSAPPGYSDKMPLVIVLNYLFPLIILKELVMNLGIGDLLAIAKA